MDALIRRQLVLAVVAAVVVLVAVLMVWWTFLSEGDPYDLVVRVAPDGTRVLTTPAESSPWAIWVAVAALVAVVGVLLMLLHHTVRIARSALSMSTSREMR